MGRQFKRGLGAGATAVIGCVIALVRPAESAAGERIASLDTSSGTERAGYIAVGATTRAPIGWVEFCLRYKGECDTKRLGAARRRAHGEGLGRPDQGQRLGQRRPSSR